MSWNFDMYVYFVKLSEMSLSFIYIFNFLLACVYVCICVRIRHVKVCPTKPEGFCLSWNHHYRRLYNMAAGNQTHVLWKSSKCS